MTSKLRDQAAIGQRYKEHLDDFHAAIDAVAQQYADEWQACFDPQGREQLWTAVQVCRKMKAHFGSFVSSGRIAQHELQELSRKSR